MKHPNSIGKRREQTKSLKRRNFLQSKKQPSKRVMKRTMILPIRRMKVRKKEIAEKSMINLLIITKCLRISK